MGPSGKPLHFKGTAFHRVISDFMLQGSCDVQRFCRIDLTLVVLVYSTLA